MKENSCVGDEEEDGGEAGAAFASILSPLETFF